VEGTGKVSKSAAMAAMFWLAQVMVGCGAPSRLMVVAMALARAWSLMRSMVVAHYVLSVAL
jgi:hypothetical protein